MDDQKEVVSNTYRGKLFKKGKINKSWKTRYFIANRALQTIQYYEKEHDLDQNKNEKGRIDLMAISRIEVLSSPLTESLPEHIIFNIKLKSDKEYTFHLVSSARTFILAASNQFELMDWLRFLHSCLYPEILKEGHLGKQGGIQKTLKSRYFVLNKLQQLKYYDSDGLNHCLGALDCARITDINDGKISTKTVGDHAYTFNIHIATKKWILAAESAEERSEWMEWMQIMRHDDWREQLNKPQNKRQHKQDKPLKINKRPMDDDSGYFERPTFDEKEKTQGKPLKVNKRPKDDDSGFFERPKLDQSKEITERDVHDEIVVDEAMQANDEEDDEEEEEKDEVQNNANMAQMMGGMMNMMNMTANTDNTLDIASMMGAMMNNIQSTQSRSSEADDAIDCTPLLNDVNDEIVVNEAMQTNDDDEEEEKDEVGSSNANIAQMMGGMMNMMNMMTANTDNTLNIASMMGGMMNNMQSTQASEPTEVESDDAIDCTPLVHAIESHPKSDKERLKCLRGILTNTLECWSEWLHNTTYDAWIAFDTGSLHIEVIEITFPGIQPQNYHAKTIKIWTASSYPAMDSEWTLIQSKTDIALQKEKNIPDASGMGGIMAAMNMMNASSNLTAHKLYLTSHQRYIKVVFSDRTGEKIGLKSVKWSGHEDVIEDEITNKGIKIYQCSGGTGKPSEAEMIFKANTDVFEADAADKAWIIFDLKRFEVERIKIQFDAQCKPEMVKLRMSDVAPLYSFHQVSAAMKWKLNTIHSFEESDWEHVSLIQELKLSGNEYNNGFKRFIHLEFSSFSAHQMKIVRVEWFGALSTRITKDDEEQFDPVLDGALKDEKEADTAPYKPVIVDHTASQSGFSVEHIFDDDQTKFWMTDPMSGFGAASFLVIDDGNNAVEGLFVKAFGTFPFKTLRVLTSDKSKTKKWQLLFVDDEMESKADDGGTYDLKGYNVKKYIRMEFEGMALPMFGLSSVKLYGKGPFLTTMEKDVTLEDIKAMQWVDEDIIQRYQNKLLNEQYRSAGATMQQQHQNAEPLTDEWIRKKEQFYSAWSSYWKMTELHAYLQKTLFERDEMLQLSVTHETIGKESIKQMVDFEIEREREKKALEEEEEKAKELGQNGDEIQREKWQDIVQMKKERETEYREQYTALYTDLNSKVFSSGNDNKDNILIYEAWKDAVLNHPMELSLEYNAEEYEKALSVDAYKYDKDGYMQCLSKLSHLFDESLRQRKALLHKFLLYQLSTNYHVINHESHAHETVMILFDVGEDFNQKIQRVEFKTKEPHFKRIIVSTANALNEQKQEDDDEETAFVWDNFEIIGQFMLNDTLKASKKEYLGFEDTKIMLNYKNKRYLKVEFVDFDEENHLMLKRVKMYMKDESDAMDDDAKENGDQLKKYKLKMMKTNSTKDENGRNTIDNAYKMDKDTRYETEEGLQTPYLIFDCEQRKIDELEMRFRDRFHHQQFDTISISTSNGISADDEWNVLFEEKGCFQSYCDAMKSIKLNRKNERYLKIRMILCEESECVEMEHLKFYTTDPAVYTWDIDQNIKNLASKMRIITATKPRNSRAESVLENNDDNGYKTVNKTGKHADYIKNKIRDEVCRGVNTLRSSRGGALSKGDKHFIKFLLCFQNDKCYDEMLYSAKLVMNILRKPLDIEYKRLQSIDSDILRLKLDAKYQCKGVTSNHKLLSWEYSSWYRAKKAMFWPKDLKHLTEEWANVGVKLKDPEFTTIRRAGILSTDKTFISCEQLAMKYLNAIAHILDAPFQKAMRDTFKENRMKLKMAFPPQNNKDLGVQSGPVKTEARQKIKILLKYFSKEAPQCMAVLDIVRCGIVCEDDVELCSLFNLIMAKFSGSILRVKNAFDDIKKGDDSHGYRAVMINMAFGDESLLPKGFRMVCEAQLLLNKYYQVRKNMHLGYGICRSEDGGISHNKKPYVVLAQDACKLGKLDI